MVLRYVFWDQLSESLASLQTINPTDVILFCELKEDATRVKHHKKKLVFLWSAMRHFAEQLKSKGHQVIYVTLDDPNNTQSLDSEIKRHLQIQTLDQIVVTHPSEYHQLMTVKSWASKMTQALGRTINVECIEDNRFFCNQQSFEQWAGDKKQLRMEYFYREMRKRYDVLMNLGQPEGGKWNYDAENRKPPKTGLAIPSPYQATSDEIVEQVKSLVANQFSSHFGDIEPFHFAVTRKDALQVLHHFIETRLVDFGTYQDAMIQGEPWMYHAHISFYLNCGLLLPAECIDAVEEAYHRQKAPLNAVEGFIRQIIGWREFIRGIYWLKCLSMKSLICSMQTTHYLSFFGMGKRT